MSTVTKPAQPVNVGAKPTTSPRQAAEKKPNHEQYFLFDKQNYMLMLGGVGLILLGFALMAGGKSANPHEFHYEEIYSFRRITLAPIILMLGFGLEIYAIMKKPAEVAQVAQ